MDIFSAEETNLICIFNTGSRRALINGLATAIRDVHDPEMTDIFVSVLEKLETLSDEAFDGMGFYPADDFSDGEDF